MNFMTKTTYTIKPLVWTCIGTTYSANSVIATFIIYKYSGQWFVSSCFDGCEDIDEACSGPQEGKAKAEAFYLERIKQALVPCDAAQ